MKKLKIFLLTLLMVLTILPVNTIAEGKEKPSYEPDVSVYATKTQLMDDTFAPKSGGTANNIGKIIFGKNSSGNSLEWYILGADSGVNEGENNTVIFTKSAITTNQAFENDMNTNKTYQSDFGTYNSAPQTVYPNHYGASDIRDALKDIATNTSYFTSSEQSIMNFTTISTLDVGSSVYYKNSDKLYLPYVYADDLYVIRVGSDNKKELNYVFYHWDNYNFWLRSGRVNNPSIAWYLEGKTIYPNSVNVDYAVSAAANLDLSNILFASAAKDGSLGSLDKEAPMLLRFDGSSKDLGNVSYDNENIYVSSNGDYTLFVQGRNGEQNWYYTFQLTTNNFKIRKNDIIYGLKNDASNPVDLADTDIDLSKCKIWIEREIDGLIYAVEAKKAINSVDIKIDDPVAGDSLTANAKCNTTGIDSTTPAITWSPNDETVDYSKTYQASVTLSPKTGYVFVDLYAASEEPLKTSAIVNGQTVKSVTVNTNGSMTVTYKFLKNIDKLVSVTNPDPITVDNGTSLEDMKLPETVTVETAGKSTTSLKVNWLINEITDYDPSNKNGRYLNIRGTVELPKDGSIKAISNDGPAMVEIQVTVKNAITSTPTPTPAPITPVTDDGYVVPNTGVK